MTPIQIRAAHRMNASFTKQSKEKMHDLLNVRRQARKMKVTIE